MRLSDYQSIFAQNVALLIQRIADMGYTCTFGEVLRTKEMAEIYARKGIGIKNSLHLKSLAVDLNLFKDGKYLDDTESHRQFGEWWAKLHPFNRWGGDWNKDGKPDPGENDGNHYEMREAIKI